MERLASQGSNGHGYCIVFHRTITSRGRSPHTAQGPFEHTQPEALLNRNDINNIIVFHTTFFPWPPLLLLQLPLLLLLANYHHCEDHTTTVITQTARYPMDIRPRKHPGKLASLQRSHHSSDHSDTLPKVKEEHHFFFVVAQILTSPSAVPLHIPGPSACTPSEAGRRHA